jgi:FKBP-type peptidyl-prolyl cis-trans isomerase FklB
MKKIFCVVLIVSGLSSIVNAQKAVDIKLKTKIDSVSYVVGTNIGEMIRSQGLEVNMDVLVKAVRSSVQGKKSILTEEESNALMIAQQQANSLKRKKAGDDFLAANAKNNGVKITASGLQYIVLKEGTGARPADTSTVVTHYKGMLIDGTEFDSSYKRGEPAKFQLNRVIKGWTEGLQLMQEGSKFRFFISSQLAYGERGAGNVIPPQAALVFEIELIEVQK